MSRSINPRPPAPDSHPLVQTVRYVRAPLAFLDECAARFGDLFMLRLAGLGDWVMVSNPEHLKTLFSADPQILHAGAANFSVFGPLTGDATVLTLDETPHRQRKKLLLPPFCGERLHGSVGHIRRITEQRMAGWTVGRPFSLHRELQQIALQVIFTVVFGLGDRGADPALTTLLTRLADYGAGSSLFLLPALQRDLGRYSPWGRIRRLIDDTDRALYQEIARRRAASSDAPANDILALLLSIRDEEGRSLSDRALRDELVTTLLAGHETTATALAWVFERILSLPQVHQAVLKELAQVLKGQPIEAAHLPRLTLLDAVVREALRVRPIMPNGGSRRVMAPFELGGYTIPAGATLSNCLYLLHRRPELYPEPDRFEPRRFVDNPPGPCEWTPFGGGVRRCLGMVFALVEMQVILATVLSRAHLQIERPNATIARRGFFLMPAGGTRVVLSRSVGR